jgi:transposase
MEVEEEDEEGLRRYGHSKDRRPDLPQVVIGLAVTKEGIPVKCWVLPGNTSDMKTVKMVQDELRQWKLGRCIWVMDRGMNSEENRVILQRAGGHYILGEKLRDASGKYKEALSCRGRYHEVRDNLKVKEVVTGEGQRRRRYVVVYNPEQAKKDKATREKTLKRIEESLKALEGRESKKAFCALLTDRTMGRYLKQLKSGKVKIDRRKVKAEEALDGKYLLSTSDDSLSAEDVALGYKQLLEVERAFRTLKSTLDLRPVYHRKDERIKAHVLLCFFALVLIRIAETRTGLTWERIRALMQRMHIVEIQTKDGRILQRTELTPEQSNILKKLNISPPPKVYKAESRD